MTAKYRERYSVQGLAECSVYPGVPELVQRLRDRGAKVVVATGKPTKFTVDILESAGLGGLFDDVLGSEFDGTRGQKWEVIAELLDRHGSEGAVMVGDRDNDVNGAKKCGIPCVGAEKVRRIRRNPPRLRIQAGVLLRARHRLRNNLHARHLCGACVASGG